MIYECKTCQGKRKRPVAVPEQCATTLSLPPPTVTGVGDERYCTDGIVTLYLYVIQFKSSANSVDIWTQFASESSRAMRAAHTNHARTRQPTKSLAGCNPYRVTFDTQSKPSKTRISLAIASLSVEMCDIQIGNKGNVFAMVARERCFLD